MALVSIPTWNSRGLIPPCDQAKPASPERSPYVVSLTDFVVRFGTSADRRKILKGFLDYRADLHQAGMQHGFQWLDGSFLEDVETLRGLSPKDLDVVTFFKLPEGVSQKDVFQRSPKVFDSRHVKTAYHVDAYAFDLRASGERLVGVSAYWYSMWSHRRVTFEWKGYVQVDLAPDDDADALAVLGGLESGGQP